MSRIFILCEGPSDRGFWSGWLKSLGCASCFEASGRHRKALASVWGGDLAPGDFTFSLPGSVDPKKADIQIHPCGDAEALRSNIATLLGQLRTKPLDALIVNIDSDRDASEDPSINSALDRVGDLIFRATGRRLQPRGAQFIDVDLPPIEVVVWRSYSPARSVGVPEKQTLERLICAALASADSARGRSVLDFLGSPPLGGSTPKNYAASYRAKWFAHRNDDLVEAIWQDSAIRGQLQVQLREIGVWDVVARILANPGASG